MTASKPAPKLSTSLPKIGAPASGDVRKKKKNRRVRGEKPRHLTVVPQHERCPEVSRNGRRIRDLDLAPRARDETAMPRRMRAMLAAKAKVEAKQGPSNSTQLVVVGTSAEGDTVGATRTRNSTEGQKRRPGSGPGVAEISAKTGKRKTARELVIETVRKTSHQHEKKKAYHIRREERAAARKERAKRRRRRRKSGDSDSSSEEDSVAGGQANHEDRLRSRNRQLPRFGEQAEAPPKLIPIVKKPRL